MGERIRRLGPTVWMASAFVVWLAAFGTMRANIPESSAPPVTAEKSAVVVNPAQAQVAAGATYVGQATCLTCHDAAMAKYTETPHNRAADPRSPAATQGCESCHGPGSKHIEDPVSVKPLSFKTMTAEQSDATCTTCHSRGEHAMWDGSQHESRGVACSTCHSVHNPLSPKGALKKASQLEVCASCHRDKVSKVDRSGHMPVREGKMECSTCHNIHGSANVKLLRKGDSVADSCTSCHADKRGPFLWEHAPVREGCTTCHDPHGSANDRMLVSKPPALCQRCHVATRHPSTIYDAGLIGTSVRVYARSCVTCHSTIHGSNHPAGNMFVR
jgi:DmsE family decaheme c-type cytochrome